MKTIENLQQKFIADTIEHGQAIDIGNHKLANKIHKRIQEIYNKVKAENSLFVFEDLINHENENVRLWAATFTLISSPKIAEKALNELTKLTNIRGLTAQTTLHLWKQGKLNLL